MNNVSMESATRELNKTSRRQDKTKTIENRKQTLEAQPEPKHRRAKGTTRQALSYKPKRARKISKAQDATVASVDQQSR